MRTSVILVALSMLMPLMAAPAAGAGSVSVENRTNAAVKVAGEGGSARVGASADPVAISFEGGKDVGIDLKVWWATNPRELCQLFVPWGRTVIVSGSVTIRCRSE